MNAIGELINFEAITKNCREMNANETLMQLKMNNIHKFMCWGTTSFTVDNLRNVRMLRFHVNGAKLKGFVYMFVNGSDLYDIYLTKKDGTIVHKTEGEGLYFDDTTDWIDERIEKLSTYAF
jgi:hypothetical protein